ncbi:DUF4365 domain-containing protein [Scytonema hofmannii]|uniref:DUF4365 domain-containing protein n=1 Tax=Scytonema hofmannii TaxID=34078 RepID=UPI00034BDA57|nr:DUF4365 domain-containing protein [Scytonema hofmannii]
MSLNTQKEDFSYAYVYAVTAAAGYSLQAATRRLDLSGIDATITYRLLSLNQLLKR